MADEHRTSAYRSQGGQKGDFQGPGARFLAWLNFTCNKMSQMMPAFSLGLSVSGLEACKMKVNRLTSMETDQAKRSRSFDKVVRVLLYIFM